MKFKLILPILLSLLLTGCLQQDPGYYSYEINNWCTLTGEESIAGRITCGSNGWKSGEEIVPEEVVDVADTGNFLIFKQRDIDSGRITYYAIAPPRKILAKWQNLDDLVTEEINKDILKEAFESAKFIPFTEGAYDPEIYLKYELVPFSGQPGPEGNVIYPRKNVEIPERVIALGWDENWILIKRQPSNIDITKKSQFDYWILDVSKKTGSGPLDQSQYKILKDTLGVPSNIELRKPEMYIE